MTWFIWISLRSKQSQVLYLFFAYLYLIQNNTIVIYKLPTLTGDWRLGSSNWPVLFYFLFHITLGNNSLKLTYHQRIIYCRSAAFHVSFYEICNLKLFKKPVSSRPRWQTCYIPTSILLFVSIEFLLDFTILTFSRMDSF